jgi:hypothetical protein
MCSILTIYSTTDGPTQEIRERPSQLRGERDCRVTS